MHPVAKLTTGQVSEAYQKGFIALFGICLASSLAIVVLTSRVPIGKFSSGPAGMKAETLAMSEVEEDSTRHSS